MKKLLKKVLFTILLLPVFASYTETKIGVTELLQATKSLKTLNSIASKALLYCGAAAMLGLFSCSPCFQGFQAQMDMIRADQIWQMANMPAMVAMIKATDVLRKVKNGEIRRLANIS